jgi:hypothetical protein
MGDGAGQFALHVRQTASSCVMNSVISSATGVELGDPAKDKAFEEIAGIESRRLFAGALSILRDAGEAQDAVPEMLVRALRAQGSLIRADSPSRWLTRGASTAASAYCRHLRSRGWPPVDPSVHRGHRVTGLRGPSNRHGSCLPPAVARTANGHAHVRLWLLRWRMRGFDELSARNSPQPCGTRACHFPKGAE